MRRASSAGQAQLLTLAWHTGFRGDRWPAAAAAERRSGDLHSRGDLDPHWRCARPDGRRHFHRFRPPICMGTRRRQTGPAPPPKQTSVTQWRRIPLQQRARCSPGRLARVHPVHAPTCSKLLTKNRHSYSTRLPRRHVRTWAKYTLRAHSASRLPVSFSLFKGGQYELEIVQLARKRLTTIL